MSAMASQITSLAIVYDQTSETKHHSFAALAFVWGIHRWPVNSPHKGPVTSFHLMTSSCVIECKDIKFQRVFYLKYIQIFNNGSVWALYLLQVMVRIIRFWIFVRQHVIVI